MTATIDKITEKYIAYRDFCKKQEDELTAKLKPYKEAMAVLEGAASETMGAAQSVRTEFGTAYRTETLSTRVADRGIFMAFVQHESAFDLLTSAVSKDAVKDFMEANGGTPPPGVDLTYVRKINFRRS